MGALPSPSSQISPVFTFASGPGTLFWGQPSIVAACVCLKHLYTHRKGSSLSTKWPHFQHTLERIPRKWQTKHMANKNYALISPSICCCTGKISICFIVKLKWCLISKKKTKLHKSYDDFQKGLWLPCYLPEHNNVLQSKR